MSDSQKRRPAHEVLLDELKALARKYRELVEQSDAGDENAISSASHEILIIMVKALISLVTGVLHEMVIPEKELSAVIRSIEESADVANYVQRGEDESPAWAMIENVIVGLKMLRGDKF